MKGLDTYLLALGLYVVLYFVFRLFMRWWDNNGGPTAGGMAVMAALFLTTAIGTAQKHYPLVEGEEVITLGEVSTLELFHKTEAETGKQYLIFYNWEGAERWAAVELYKYELEEFYKLMEQSVIGMHSRFGIRGSTFTFHHYGLSASDVFIVDSFGQSIHFKVNKNKLKQLFGL